jgi:FkbM family methyltransferase
MSLIDPIVSALRPFHIRGKGRLFSKFVRNEGTRRANVFGCQIDLDLGDLIQRMIYLGTYEQQETRLLHKYLKPGMTVVDVGANVGYYTLLSASKVGLHGRVYSFEPSPYAAQRLENTVQEDRLGNVRVFPTGLGERRGEELLFAPLAGNHSPSMFGVVGAEARSVAITTLDAIMEELQVDAIHLLKIDVEGYEGRVLAGAAKLLSQGRIRAILCEFNDYWLHRAGTDGASLYQQLVDSGFVDACGPPPVFANQVLTRLMLHRSGAYTS